MKKISAVFLLILFAANVNAALTSQLGVLNLAANGGINPATGLAWQAGDTYRLVFITSTETNAVSDSLSYYDSNVQARANASSITSLSTVTWQAVVSGEGIAARDHTGTNPGTDGSTTSIWLINGTEIIGNNYNSFWSNRSSLNQAIDRTESNLAVPNNDGTGGWDAWRGTWTGTNGNGTMNSTGINAASPLVGLANAGWGGFPTDDWVNRGADADTSTYRLYAISEELTVIPEPSSLAILIMGALAMGIRRRRA